MPKRRHTYPLVAVLTAAATALAVSPAGAATGGELTVGSLGGANVDVGDTLSAPLTGSAVFTTSAGKITCTSGSFTATDATNPAEGVAEATETVTALHFVPTSCTDTIAGTSGVVSIDLKTNANATVVDEPGDNPLILQVTGLDEKVTLRTSLGNLICDYGTAGSVTEVDGTLSAANNSVTFTNSAVNKVSGSFVCPGSGTFSAAYGPITDSSQGGQLVFVN